MNAVAAGRLSQRAGIKTKRKGHGPETVPATAAGRALLQHLKPVAPCSRRGGNLPATTIITCRPYPAAETGALETALARPIYHAPSIRRREVVSRMINPYNDCRMFMLRSQPLCPQN